MKKITILFLIGIALAVFNLGSKSFWFDEAYSVYVSKTWLTMVHILTTQDPNMWFYYFLLHFWQKIGTNEFTMRSLSVIFSVLSIYPTYLLGNHFRKNAGFIAGLFMSINVLFIYYAQDARSYALLLFLITTSSYAFLKISKKTKFKLIYVISSILAVYTHFYALLIIASQFLYIVYSKQTKKYFWLLSIIFISILPLLYLAPLSSHVVDWINKPTIISLFGTAMVLMGDFPPLFLIFSVLLISFLPILYKKYKEYLYLIIWLVFPIIAVFIISLIYKPLYQSVYFIICLPPLAILLAMSLENLKKIRLLYYLLILFIISSSLVRLVFWYSGNNSYKWLINNKNEDWRGATNYITNNSLSHDIIVFYGYNGFIPYSIYRSGLSPKIVEIASNTYMLGGGYYEPQPNEKLITSFNNSRIWLMLNRYYGEKFDRQKKTDEILYVLNKNYYVVQKKDFYDIRVNLFKKKYEN